MLNLENVNINRYRKGPKPQNYITVIPNKYVLEAKPVCFTWNLRNEFITLLDIYQSPPDEGQKTQNPKFHFHLSSPHTPFSKHKEILMF